MCGPSVMQKKIAKPCGGAKCIEIQRDEPIRYRAAPAQSCARTRAQSPSPRWHLRGSSSQATVSSNVQGAVLLRARSRRDQKHSRRPLVPMFKVQSCSAPARGATENTAKSSVLCRKVIGSCCALSEQDRRHASVPDAGPRWAGTRCCFITTVAINHPRLGRPAPALLALPSA